MDNTLIGRVSNKGQIIIPSSVSKLLGLTKGSEVFLTVGNEQITIKKLPTKLDWDKVISDIPVEVVDIDENGHYNPEKSPDFHDWMANG